MQFLRSSKSIDADLVLASFGSSSGYHDYAFRLDVAADPSASSSGDDSPLRYAKLPEIHHIFKQDPPSPHIVFTLIFTIIVLATLCSLFGAVGLSQCDLC